jgi:hypothetical protein
MSSPRHRSPGRRQDPPAPRPRRLRHDRVVAAARQHEIVARSAEDEVVATAEQAHLAREALRRKGAEHAVRGRARMQQVEERQPDRIDARHRVVVRDRQPSPAPSHTGRLPMPSSFGAFNSSGSRPKVRASSTISAATRLVSTICASTPCAASRPATFFSAALCASTSRPPRAMISGG